MLPFPSALRRRALTLEALNLSLDPLRRKLKPLPMILALSLPGNQR